MSHTYIHPFNGPLCRTTRVSWYQKGKANMDFTEAKDSEWQWHQLGRMQVCTSLQTDNHASTPPLIFFTGWMLCDIRNQTVNKPFSRAVRTMASCSCVGAQTRTATTLQPQTITHKMTSARQQILSKWHSTIFSLQPGKLVAWYSGRTSVSGRRTFHVLRSTCS